MDGQQTIAVLGGGVSGITTAVLLQLAGYDTTLYTIDQPVVPAGAPRPPEFASIHAAASVLPHSVQGTRMATWTNISRQFFRAFAFRADAGVRTQTHYELFESDRAVEPPYAASVDNFEVLDEAHAPSNDIPRRFGAVSVIGWRFGAYFCEAPTYLRHLYRLYEAAAGDLVIAHEAGLNGYLEEFLRLGHAMLVNCTGHGTFRLLDPDHLDGIEDQADGGEFVPLIDPWGARVVRGHYVRAALGVPLVDRAGRFISYNYTPPPAIYPAGKGVAADVYCYPRSDEWILGGSRQLRTSDPGGDRWVGEDAGYETVTLSQSDGQTLAVPRPILSLNDEIITGMSGGDVVLGQLFRERPEAFVAGIGYRFERSHPTESVRLDCSLVGIGSAESVVIHNYGHGGAGFTLSWGCASDVLTTVRALTRKHPSLASARSSAAVPEEFQTIAAMLRKLVEHILVEAWPIS